MAFVAEIWLLPVTSWHLRAAACVLSLTLWLLEDARWLLPVTSRLLCFATCLSSNTSMLFSITLCPLRISPGINAQEIVVD
jgi:hypothetical protein